MTGSANPNEREGTLIGGLILVGIGIYFLLWEFGYLPGLHKFWPVILIIVGLSLILGHIRSPWRSRGKEKPFDDDSPPGD